MYFRSYVLNTILKNNPSETVAEGVKYAITLLKEPKNAAIVTLSLTGAYLVCRCLFTNEKSIPVFPGASLISGHRALLEKSSAEGEFARDVNIYNYPLGYF